MVMDNAMEKTAGELIKKRGMQISISAQLKILSPWMNWDELGLQEAKKGVYQKTIKKQSPKVLWEDCTELEAMIKYHTYHDIYELKGKVSETMVIG